MHCTIYRNWATALTGHPTVIECTPTTTRGDPIQHLERLHELLQERTEEDAGQEPLPQPSYTGPELIGQRYLVYKAIGKRGGETLYELRVVIDKETSKTMWAGGVYKGEPPGIPKKPPQPRLPPPPEDSTPPQAPQGQKTIRKPVVYSAEGPHPVEATEAIRLGTYDEHGPTITSRAKPGREEALAGSFHCVTGWSVSNIRWSGARLLDLLEEHGLKGEWIIAVSSGGYTATIPYDERLLDDALIATSLDDNPLPREHGGPYRLVIPKLFGWKSVKWLWGILVGDTYLDGYWEARGYHWRGLVKQNERFK